ncbi:MAG: Rrf2 family transcriptional regulator [Bacteroidota bacterium]
MSKVVSLSEASSLAIHAMVMIAQSNKMINVNTISEATGASRNHLAKVMQRLVKGGLVKSTRGPSGGFLLNKPAKTISLLNIYESIEGAIDMAGCPLDRQICPFNKCLMGNLVYKVTDEIKEYFQSQNLENFIK